ncbi:hypothetical protein DFS33DRAFT_1450559 [Desarmillaria ectypa]|nr:hypothetical protein DFS33DRAFT_1450559 [Desarmillaria ectypa]
MYIEPTVLLRPPASSCSRSGDGNTTEGVLGISDKPGSDLIPRPLDLIVSTTNSAFRETSRLDLNISGLFNSSAGTLRYRPARALSLLDAKAKIPEWSRPSTSKPNRTSGLQLMQKQQNPEECPADIMVFMELIRGVDDAHGHNHDTIFPLRIVTLKTSAKGVSDEELVEHLLYEAPFGIHSSRFHWLGSFSAFRLPQGLEATAAPSPIVPGEI